MLPMTLCFNFGSRTRDADALTLGLTPVSVVILAKFASKKLIHNPRFPSNSLPLNE
jgi:hypothetical protein